MKDQSTSRMWYGLLFSLPPIVALNLYVMFKDLLFVVKASGITFIILFIFLTLSLIYEQVTQKAIFDAQDNVGKDVVYQAAMGKDLFERYESIISKLPRKVSSLVLTKDLSQLMIAYEAIQDLHRFKDASDQVHDLTGFRDVINKRLTMLEDPSFVETIHQSFYHYPHDGEYNNCTPEQKQKKIEQGVQENGYNMNDPYYELKVKSKESTQFEELAIAIVKEATPEEIRTELFA